LKEEGLPEKSDKFRPPYFTDGAPQFESDMPVFMAYEAFGQLIPDGADPYYLRMLGDRTAGAWAQSALARWRNKVMVGFELLERVPPEFFHKLADLTQLTMTAYREPQKLAFFASKDRQSKEKEEEPEVRFPSLLNEYLHQFESVYRHIASVFAFAKEAVFHNPHAGKLATWYLEQSAKTKAAKLDTLVTLAAGSISTLIEGYERHFRNAIAHSGFRFIDRDTVEMWDINDKMRETWRERLSYEECEAKLKALRSTVTAMEAAYFLFVMNNHSRLPWQRANAHISKLSREELNELIYVLCRQHYDMDIIEVRAAGRTLCIETKLIPNFTIPQTRKVYIGGPKGAQAFDIEVRVIEVPLPNVVFGLLRNVTHAIEGIEEVTLCVQDAEANAAARVCLRGNQVEVLKNTDPDKLPVEEIECTEKVLANLSVKYTIQERPKPAVRKPPTIILPPEKKIIIP
jgi:hypothetical protein